ncbi:Acyltransferase LovD [Colletotrichum orbiculare MAFF 240422]|uniref:Acyltransferase LovD n=1 Tax=Colletotrichum orbiculare (strain 104-T / ATCC 96160 / CBS 514.97 / LARS 414 / MAFF 240422) TaxID=1213857 RepID=N4UW56_COLOR|nr:Acyltransferase LovD [Colletotrichum orbiculare MAFF 240422]
MQISEHLVQTLRHTEGQPLPRVTLGAVSRDGSLHFVKHFGDPDSGDNAGTDAVHWIASCTKLVTTIAVLQCVERGQLKLDEDISSILPEWKDPKILTGFDEKNEAQFRPAKRFITLRQLLTHSSGLAYPFMHPLCAKYNEIKKAPLIQQTVRAAFPAFLLFEPGDQWLYGPGLEWAGLMVEAVNGGMKLGEYMQKHIFDPLSITDVTFHLEQREDLRGRKAKFWTRVGPELQETESFWPDPVEDDIGGGGIYTTVTELLRLYRGFLQGKLLEPETMAEMVKPQLETRKGLENPEVLDVGDRNATYNTIPSDVPVDFGLGGLLNLAPVPGGRASHSLTWSGYPNCYWWVDVANGVAGVYLSQLAPTGDQKAVELLAEFEKSVYAALSKS